MCIYIMQPYEMHDGYRCRLLRLQVLESVVKNCGQTVHDEVASKQTMEELKDLLKVSLPLVSVMSLITSLIMSLLDKYHGQHFKCDRNIG